MITSLLLSFFLLAQSEAPKVGPATGALIVDGGAENSESIKRFVALAGGPDSPVVLIPTASESEQIDLNRQHQAFTRRFGLKNVTVLHTRDRAEADKEEFVAPLKSARGVWFGGGRQWRLVDAYMGTRTQREIEAVLSRGGVIGGSSAGATIQGSYLVRGAREGNHIMMAKGYERGLRLSARRGRRPAPSGTQTGRRPGRCDRQEARATRSGPRRTSRNRRSRRSHGSDRAERRRHLRRQRTRRQALLLPRARRSVRPCDAETRRGRASRSSPPLAVGTRNCFSSGYLTALVAASFPCSR